MITKDKLKNLVLQPEGQYLEKKSAKLKESDISAPISAFANSQGGLLLIGVEDDGTLTGFKNARHTVNEFIHAAQNNCFPPAKLEFYTVPYGSDSNDYILVIDVSPASNSVIRTQKGEVKVRVNDKSVTCTYDYIKQLERDKGLIRGEDITIDEASLDDLDTSLLQKYKDLTETSMDYPDILKARGLIINNKLTVAALLLFGKNPTQFIPQARVRFLRYEGITQETGTRLNIIKDVSFDSPIPELINKIVPFMESVLRDFNALSPNGEFTKIPEYPQFAWLEGIINALTHRDYLYDGDHIKIKMFDDRLEIISPGKLPNTVTLDNITTTRYSRNPKLARILSEFGFVKELNEGVNRIFKEMALFFLDPPIYAEPNNSSVQLTLKNNIGTRYLRTAERTENAVLPNIWKNLNSEEKYVLQFLHTHSKITNTILRESLGITRPIATKILNNLVDKKLIKLNRRNINDPKQYYSLID